jgi:hypothetical protein
MGRRFVDMSVIQRRMQFKDDRINRRLAKAQMTDLAPTLPAPDVIAKVLLGGDLAQLSAQQKISYYRSVCESLGLNPLTQPFEYLRLSGREVLYARRNATDQLRHLHHISVTITARELVEDCYVVTARAAFPDGRHDESIGAVPIAGLKGESRSNAMMKAETKAKRRVTLSLVGLSTLDESEVDSIPGAQVVPLEPGRECSPPPLNKSLTPSPGPAVPTTVITDPGLGVPAAPANMPESWQPFVVDDPDRLRGQIVAIHDETKTGKKSGRPFTKWSITLEGGETVTTLDRDVASLAMTARDDGRAVEVVTKSTRWGKDVVTIATLPTPGDEIPF